MSSPRRRVSRFPINPVELVIFSVVVLVFMNSVYHLFYDWKGFHPTTLGPAERSIASQQPAILTLNCDLEQKLESLRPTIRLAGPLCTDGAVHSVEIRGGGLEKPIRVPKDVKLGMFTSPVLQLSPGQSEFEVTYLKEDAATGAPMDDDQPNRATVRKVLVKF